LVIKLDSYRKVLCPREQIIFVSFISEGRARNDDASMPCPILCFAVSSVSKRLIACNASRTNEKHHSRLSSNWTAAAAAAAAPINLWQSCDAVANDDDKFHVERRGGRDRCCTSVNLSSSWQFISSFVVDVTWLQQLVITMSSITSFVISPDMLLYAVTLLSRMSEGKCSVLMLHSNVVFHLFALCLYLLNCLFSRLAFNVALS